MIDANDTIVFPALASQERTLIEKEYATKTVVDIGRHGKYFWIVLGDPSRTENSKKAIFDVMLLHLGMTGWIQIKGIRTKFYAMENSIDGKKREGYDEKKEKEGWPPKYHKFMITTDDGMEFSFTDPRRLGRVRFIKIIPEKTSTEIGKQVEEALMKIEPLCRSGSDFSKLESRDDESTFMQIVGKRKVPVKSLLLDQAVCAGIGNWMA